MPYEPNLVARLVAWWRESGAHERFSLLFRPHPYDEEASVRFRAAIDDPDAAVQQRSWTGPRGPGDAAPARRLCRRQRRDDHARGARQRPARGLRDLRRGRSGGPHLGRSEPDRRALPEAARVGRLPTARRSFEELVSARSTAALANPANSRRASSGRTRASSARSTAGPPSASSPRSAEAVQSTITATGRSNRDERNSTHG